MFPLEEAVESFWIQEPLVAKGESPWSLIQRGAESPWSLIQRGAAETQAWPLKDCK